MLIVCRRILEMLRLYTVQKCAKCDDFSSSNPVQEEDAPGVECIYWGVSRTGIKLGTWGCCLRKRDKGKGSMFPGFSNSLASVAFCPSSGRGGNRRGSDVPYTVLGVQ